MNTSSLLHDGVIGLRALEPTDLDVLYQWENDTTLWTVTDTVAPYSRQVLWQYLENYTADIYKSHELRLMAVMEDTGEPVGIVDLMNYSSLNNRAEMAKGRWRCCSTMPAITSGCDNSMPMWLPTMPPACTCCTKEGSARWAPFASGGGGESTTMMW